MRSLPELSNQHQEASLRSASASCVLAALRASGIASLSALGSIVGGSCGTLHRPDGT